MIVSYQSRQFLNTNFKVRKAFLIWKIRPLHFYTIAHLINDPKATKHTRLVYGAIFERINCRL